MDIDGKRLLTEANRHVSAMLVEAVRRHHTGDKDAASDDAMLSAARRLLEVGLPPESVVAIAVSTSAAYITSMLARLGVDPVAQMEAFEFAFLYPD